MGKEEKAEFKIEYAHKMKRVYFNRYKFFKQDGLMCVRVWFQDEMTRICNPYAFVFPEEDFQGRKNSIKTYLQKVMQSVVARKSSVDYQSPVCPVEIQEVDTARAMMCSRVGNRAEIYLGYFPLVKQISGETGAEDRVIQMDVALCSELNCHISLLQNIVK